MEIDRADDYLYRSEFVRFSPCDTCGEEQARVYVRASRQLIFYCKNESFGLHARKWRNRTAIAGGEFLPGGAFAGLIGREYLGKDPIDAALKIPSGVVKRIEATQPQCVFCPQGTPPLTAREMRNDRIVASWLSRNRPELFSDVVETLKKFRIEASADLWMLQLQKANGDLFYCITHELRSTTLHVDHGIPKHRMRERFADTPWKIRHFALNWFAFHACERHNLSKNKKLLTRDELINLYVKWCEGGDEARAKANARKWAFVEATVEAYYTEARQTA